MDQLIELFTNTLGRYLSAEAVIFIISMFPLLELRGGLVAAALLGVPMFKAVPICIFGNIIPIPFILLFIKKIFAFMKNHGILVKLITWLENRAMKKSDAFKKGEFWGLLLFVGIPLPGTGAWMGSLAASLFGIKIKKAVIAELLGLFLATTIMVILVYLCPDIAMKLFHLSAG